MWPGRGAAGAAGGGGWQGVQVPQEDEREGGGAGGAAQPSRGPAGPRGAGPHPRRARVPSRGSGRPPGQHQAGGHRGQGGEALPHRPHQAVPRPGLSFQVIRPLDIC